MWGLVLDVMVCCMLDVCPCPYRLLVGRARKIAQQYQLEYNESIPVSQLVQKLATVVQEFTQSGWVSALASAWISTYQHNFEYYVYSHVRVSIVDPVPDTFIFDDHLPISLHLKDCLLHYSDAVYCTQPVLPHYCSCLI